MIDNTFNANKGDTYSHNSAANDTSSSNIDYDYLLDSNLIVMSAVRLEGMKMIIVMF